MIHRIRRPGVALALGIALCAAAPGRAAESREGRAVATTPRFAFYSDFASNLHDVLLEAGRDRNFDRPELFQAGEAAACFEALPPEERLGWEQAVAFYAEIISPNAWDERAQLLMRLALSGVEPVERERDRKFVQLVRSYLGIATPAYATCRWEDQDAENRVWIAKLIVLLERHEEAIAQGLVALYKRPLAGLPMRVDVVETVNWSGATTILLDPVGGHIQASSDAYAGLDALEIAFHEASHTLMGHAHPVQQALAGAAEELGLPLPPDLWHAVLFYTTGDTVRRALEAAAAGTGTEDTGYTPMLFAGNIFGKYHAALKSEWTGYLTGERTLDEAVRGLVGSAASSALK